MQPHLGPPPTWNSTLSHAFLYMLYLVNASAVLKTGLLLLSSVQLLA